MQLISTWTFEQEPYHEALTDATSTATRACTLASLSRPSAGVSGRHLNHVYRLCEMLNTMIDTPCLRQDTLSVLAVNANLVPRLWCGALKVCAHHCRAHFLLPPPSLKPCVCLTGPMLHLHGSPPVALRGHETAGFYVQDNWASAGWCPPQDDRRDPGWMLPLLVLSEAYSTYLSTFGDDYMYEKQRPLPLSELYRPEGGKGLISLLKYCLWQVSVPATDTSSL